MTADNSARFVPHYAVPPGETIREFLDEMAMTQAQLADRMQRPAPTISQIVNGKKRIEPETALQLERVLGMPAHFWAGLEANYRTNLARQQEREARLKEEAKCAVNYPYAELAAHGWLPKTRKKVEKTERLLGFFGVDSFSAIDKTSVVAAFRIAAKPQNVNEYALAAWLRQGQVLAQDAVTPYFSASALESAIPELRSFTRMQPEAFQDKLCSRLASCGIVFVVLPHLKGTYAQGATQWLGRNKAVVQVTIRYRWADVFWFSLFHELGHLLLHGHQREVFINLENDEQADQLERDANKFAEDTLIPPEKLRRFRQSSTMSVDAICGFADELGIAPGIVVGRLQNDKVLDYWAPPNRLRQKYKFEGE